MAAAAAVLAIDEGIVPALNDLVVVAEAGLSATAVSSIVSLAAGRPRPFVFGTAAPLSSRNSGDAGLSFLSSHTSVAFAVVTSTVMATHRLNRRALIPALVGLIGGSLATFVGVSRVMAGQHFITDVVGGAVVGVSLGVLIPSLHRSPVKVVPVVSEAQRGLAIAGVF
jgi:membrane-associated phospholipid phosphatase